MTAFYRKKKGRSDGVPISFGSNTLSGWPMSNRMIAQSAGIVNGQNDAQILSLELAVVIR